MLESRSQAAYSPDAGRTSKSASKEILSPVTASMAVTIAAFSFVSAREWSHDGAMTGAQQARCSSVAAFMNRSISG
jgi:hypothetical protein